MQHSVVQCVAMHTHRRTVKQTPWNRLCRATGVAPLGGLRPDTNCVQFVPAEGQGLWPCAACKDAEGAAGGQSIFTPLNWCEPNGLCL